MGLCKRYGKSKRYHTDGESMSKQKRTSTIPRMKVAVDVDFIQSDSRTIHASKTITRTDIPNLSGMRIEHVDIGAKEVPCCSLCGKHLSRYGMCRDCKETRNVQELEKRRALLQDEVSNYVRDGSHRYVKVFDHNIEKGCCPSHAELFASYCPCGMAIPSGLQDCEVC